MNTVAIIVTVCLGITAASVVRRQATPPPPTSPPMKGDSTAPMVDMTSMPPASDTPMAPTNPPVVPSSTMKVVDTTIDVGTPVVTQPVTNSVTEPVTPGPVVTTMMTVVPPVTNISVTNPPAVITEATTVPTTPKVPLIEELVTVQEILEVFGNLVDSDYFKKLPLSDQFLVMEIMAGAETAKMTKVLSAVETKHLLMFMYNLPFKYADPLWRIIALGYNREEILAVQN